MHLLVPRRRRGLRRPTGTVIHTHPDTEPVPTVWRDGLPMSAAARTLADVAKAMQPEQLQLAVKQALRDGMATAGQLEEQAALRNAGQLADAIETERGGA